MTGPHPVVCFATKLTYTRGGSGYHADVVINLVIEKVEFVSGIEGEGLYANTGFPFEVALFQLFISNLLQEGTAHGIRFRDFSCFNLLFNFIPCNGK